MPVVEASLALSFFLLYKC